MSNTFGFDVISALGIMIGVLEILHRLSIKSMFQKIELKQVPVILSETQKVDLSKSCLFMLCNPMFKGFAQNTTRK